MSDLDPKLTFDSFVVGPANRLASAAARRAADSPGTSYNPLFLYSASGLGKTHILTAIAHQAQKVKGGKVEYMALEEYLERLEHSLKGGQRDGLYGDLSILLLDDVQFLTGQPEAQEMLLKTLDQLSTAGGQIVLASDRPPADIDGLDARLLSRFSGGLIVDLGPPEYETRVAIIR
jgi:chromosomal replication initiator protein